MTVRLPNRSPVALALAMFLMVLVQACEQPPRDAQTADATADATASVDSIVLERSRCYGTCPAYRIRVAGTGDVAFESRNPGDSGRVATDRVTPDAVRGLLTQAAALGFDSLPEVIANDARLCPDRATDHLTVTVTLFRPTGAKRVEDYLGCRASSDDSSNVTVRLRAFENAVDSAAGSSRWLRPADRR